jgi:antitoxin YefM
MMISEEEDEGMMETSHLLRDPANAARLLGSIEDAGQGKLVEHDPTVEGAAPPA